MATNNNGSAEPSLNTSDESGLDKSFVGKFVSGILQNTPLSKWFGKDSPGKSVRRRDDDEPDASYSLQPPSKRAKPDYNSVNTFETSVIVHNASNNVNKAKSRLQQFPEPTAGPSGISSRRAFPKSYTNPTHTINLIEVPEEDSESGESTSGYSSVPKLTEMQQKEAKISQDQPPKSMFHSGSELKHRSLFTRNGSQASSLSSRRPTFNSSTFGSLNFTDRTLSTQRILSSPFYSGNTTYGGASANSTRRYNGDGSNIVPRHTIKIKPLNEKPSRDNTSLSKTARRILNVLEQYSSAVEDAKKVPITPRRAGILTKHIGATPYTVKGKREKKPAHSTELNVPSVPELIQMKQKERLQSSTESVRQIANSSNSILNKEEYKLRQDDDKQKYSNKMKASVLTSSRPKQINEEPVSEVNLPKVALPITTLPKFELALIPPRPTQKPEEKPAEETLVKEPQIIQTPKIESKPKLQNGKVSFTFSEPLVLGKNHSNIPAINCFKFSEPLNSKVAEKGEKCRNNGESKSSEQLKSKSPGPIKAIVTEPVSLASNEDNKPISETPKSKTIPQSFGDKFKPSNNTWECGTCMIRNKQELVKCAACETPKPGPQPVSSLGKVTPPAPLIKPSFGDAFKPATDTWQCDVCLIRNKQELEKCAACETPNHQVKPVAVQHKMTIPAPVQQSFGDAFKPKSGEWECGSCFVKNKATANKCVCCETVNPKATEVMNLPDEVKQPVGGFNFGVNTGQFKFGIPQSNLKAESKPAVPVAAPNPLLKPNERLPQAGKVASAGFTFGIAPEVKKTEEKPAPAKSESPVGAAKPAIVFSPPEPKQNLFTSPKQSPGTLGGDSLKRKDSGLFPLNNKPKDSLFGSSDRAAFLGSDAKKSKPLFAQSPGFVLETKMTPPKPLFGVEPKAAANPVNNGFGGFGGGSQSFTGGEAKPFGASTPKPFGGADLKPFGGAATEAKPFGGAATEGKPFGGTAAEVKPFGGTVAEAKPFGGVAAAEAKPFGGAATEAKLFGGATTEAKPFGGAASESKIFGGPVTEAKPFGGAAPSESKLFGAAATEAKPFGGAAEQKTFGFGADSVPPKSNSFGFTAPSTTPSFSFGSTTANNVSFGGTASSVSFGAPAAATTTTSAGFKFTTTPSSSGFNFGAAKTPAASFGGGNMFGAGAVAKNGTFNFGSNANNNTEKPVFTFGASQSSNSTQQSNQGGAGFSSLPQSGFNFAPVVPTPVAGAPPATTPGAASSYNFSGPPPTFNFNDGNLAQPQRKIKRAIRRTMR